MPSALLGLALRSGESATGGSGPGSTVVPLDPSRAEVGTPAPDFTLPKVGGGTVSLTELRGRPVVLNFFASWCVPCEEEMPILERLDRTGAVEVVAVTFRDSPGDARRFVGRLGLGFPVLLDDDGSNPVARAYGVRSPPMTFFIGRDGTIAAPPVYGGAGPVDLGPGLARIAPGFTPPS
ncbi:MAG: TlpA family protein disulfide reductase [Actinomycetota bacterium]